MPFVAPGQGRCARSLVVLVYVAPGQGRCAPRGQSLLRSFLATRSFPPRPPAYVLAALGTDHTALTHGLNPYAVTSLTGNNLSGLE